MNPVTEATAVVEPQPQEASAPAPQPPAAPVAAELQPTQQQQQEQQPHHRENAKTQDAETAVLAMIDGSGPETEKRVPLRDLQRACARLPLLSTILTGERRYKLYVQLLLDEGTAPAKVAVESFPEASAKASEAHRAVAARILAAFPSGHFSSTALVEGFVFSFAAEAGYSFSPEESAVMVVMAGVVASGKLATGEESLTMLYNLMAIVAKDFLPSSSSRLYDGATVLLLRLILQYQDPVLSAHLDHRKVNTGALLLALTRRLFVPENGSDNAESSAAALSVWDWIFVLGDPVLVPYVAIAVLATTRQHLLSLTSADELQAALASFAVSLSNDKSKAVDPKLADGRSIALVPVWSGKSLCQNADLLFRSTPQSAQRVLEFCLCPESGSINKTPQALEEYYAGAPVLPLERSDIASSFSAQPAPLGQQLEYVMVDCRSQGSYEYARLPTAVLVGDVVGYDEERLSEVVARLRPSMGYHLSFFGTGRALVEEVNLLKLTALRLLQHGFPFVSITTGGFKSVIPLIKSKSIRVVLNNGNPLPEGEQHSLLAGLPSKITELRDEYLPASAEAAKLRAAELSEELREKAKEGLTTASMWGWGLFSRAQESLSSAKEAASAAVARAGESVAAATSSAAAPSGPAATTTTPATATTATAPSVTPGPPLQGRVAPPQPAVRIFTLGDEDEDDDFDLITAVPPPKPSKGTLVNTEPASTPAPVTSAATASVSAPASAAAPATTTAPPTGAEAAASGTSGTITQASPSGQAGSAAQIAASIDKEFDDLFGS